MPNLPPRRSVRAAVALVAGGLSTFGHTGIAHADGLYGRFDGDVMIAGGVGGGVAVDRDEVSGLVTAEFRARYLDAVGPFALVEGWSSGWARVVVGVDVRPLFPTLFLLNAFTGNEWLDLTLQSLGLELGVGVGPLGGPDEVGAAWVVGMAAEFPVVLPSVFGQGMFFRLAARHTTAGSQDVAAPSSGASDWTVTLSWLIRGSVGLGVASLEPRRYRPD